VNLLYSLSYKIDRATCTLNRANVPKFVIHAFVIVCIAISEYYCACASLSSATCGLIEYKTLKRSERWLLYRLGTSSMPSVDNVPFLILRKECLFVSFLAVICYCFVLHLACIRFLVFRYNITKNIPIDYTCAYTCIMEKSRSLESKLHLYDFLRICVNWHTNREGPNKVIGKRRSLG